MPYTWILPSFGLALLAGLGFYALCALVPALRSARTAVGRALLGAGAGFLLANLASAVLGLVPAAIGHALDVAPESAESRIVAGFVLAGLFIGPLIVSPLGALAGAWIGLRRARATA